MKIILAMLIASACCLVARADRFDFNSRVGVVDTNSEGRVCLKISNPHLVEGTEVSFVLLSKPQRVAKATVEGKASPGCSRNPDTGPDASFYWLRLVGRKQAIDLGEPLPPAIAVVLPAGPISVKRGAASGDLDGDGRAEFFRICTSNEGNHLTLWSGKPLMGKKKWHSYYYLGYDVVPTCKKKDYQ